MTFGLIPLLDGTGLNPGVRQVIILLLYFAVSGGLFKAPRFHLYGFLVFISFVWFEHLFLKGHVSDHGIPAAAFISGGIIILSGILHLIFFLRKYRLETE